MVAARCVRGLLLLVVLVVASIGVVNPAQASHIHVEGHCVDYLPDPTAGGLRCVVGGGGSTGGSTGIRTGGGKAACYFPGPSNAVFEEGQEIPCSDPEYGVWSTSLGCFVREVDDPEMFPPDGVYADGEDPWQGNYPDGSLYHCTPNLGGDQTTIEWLASTPQPVLVNPEDLARLAVDAAGLEGVDPACTSPPPLSVDADSMGLVGLPVWLCSEDTDIAWGPMEATASALGVTVTANAGVDVVVWNMGDGHTVPCTTPGTPYNTSYGVEAKSPDCPYVYTQGSRDQGNTAYTVIATSNWDGDWSGGGQDGTVELELESDPEELRVGEMQAIRVS